MNLISLEAAVSLDVQQLVGVEALRVEDLRLLALLHLLLDQLVRVEHPLADKGEDGPLQDPLAVAEAHAVLRRRALEDQEGEAQEDGGYLQAKDRVEQHLVMLAHQFIDDVHVINLSKMDIKAIA